MKKRILLTIVIPVYNLENYIEECLNSIKNQTFYDFEVIIVNDGSTDNSQKIIEGFISNDSRFKLINQKNGGAASARNTGIKTACGEYITFVDGDDYYLNDTCLETIMQKVQEFKPDMLQYKMVMYYPNNNKYVEEPNITTEDKYFYDMKDYLKNTIQNSKMSVSPCDKIIKTKLLLDKEIFFEKMAMLEDIDWSFTLYQNIDNIFVFNFPAYVYRKQRPNSTTYSYNLQKMHACLGFLEKWSDRKNYKITDMADLFFSYVAYQYIIFITIYDSKVFNKEENNKIKELKWLLEYNLNFKVAKSQKIYKMFGYGIMKFVLKTYMFLKQANLVRIR